MHVPGFGGVGNDKNISQLANDELISFRESKKIILANHCMFNVHAAYYLNMYNPFYYTLFRDPVKRFISHYNFFYRDLGYDELKSVSLDELPEEKCSDLLLKMANIQLVYTINLEKPIGRKADETWLEEAKKNLVNWYGCIGVLEKMDLSLQLLKASSPDWLAFPDITFPVKNEGRKNSENQLHKPGVIEQIEKHNYYDLKLYEFACALLEKRVAGI